jgi:hypothetical protein
MLIDAAEDRGPMLFAKMGIQRATERYTGQSPFLTTVEAQDPDETSESCRPTE